MIYFMEADNGLIKIGYSWGLFGPRRRVGTLRCESGWNVRLLWATAGHRKHEKMLHKAFAYLRYQGEWFLPGTCLLEFIDKKGGP